MNTSYAIFLDDLRTVDMVYSNPEAIVAEKNMVICRTMEEAVELIESRGFLPDYISFDNDLGEDANNAPLKEGIDFAHWIVESVLDGKFTLPEDFTFFVHSANTIAGPEIKILLDNFIKFQKQNS